MTLQSSVFDLGMIRDFQIQHLEKKLPGSNQVGLPRVVLTDRDYEALNFIIEMKFATFDEIYRKFFKTLNEQGQEFGFWYTKKRLVLLAKAGYLKSIFNFANSERLYLATLKSFYALSRAFPERLLAKPIANLDSRTFDHDSLVSRCREVLEPGISSWISDRQLRCFPELAGELTGNYVPDAIYTNELGEKIAFELELSIKAKERYREKVRKYLSLLHSTNAERPFSKVHFVCAKDQVRAVLETEAKMYPDLFKIESLETFLSNNSK